MKTYLLFIDSVSRMPNEFDPGISQSQDSQRINQSHDVSVLDWKLWGYRPITENDFDFENYLKKGLNM